MPTFKKVPGKPTKPAKKPANKKPTPAAGFAYGPLMKKVKKTKKTPK